jgi:hypothetical protein
MIHDAAEIREWKAGRFGLYEHRGHRMFQGVEVGVHLIQLHLQEVVKR